MIGYPRFSSLMNFLCKLHNYCIDNGERAQPTKPSGLKEIRKSAKNHESDKVTLDQHGRPIDHTRLESKNHATVDEMIATIKQNQLQRPY